MALPRSQNRARPSTSDGGRRDSKVASRRTVGNRVEVAKGRHDRAEIGWWR